jgi:hypothetical protein
VAQAIARGEIDLDRARRVLYEFDRIGAKLRAELHDAEMEEEEQFAAELQEDGHICLSNKSFGIKIEI